MLNNISQREQNYPIERRDLVIVVVDSLDFLCSRTKLMQHSEFFNVLLSKYAKEGGVVTLKEIDGTTMEELLMLVHCGAHSVRSCELPGVIFLCDMLLFNTFKEQLIHEAYQRLSEENCLKIWLKLEILSLIPLVWQAKCMSLTTFAHQRAIGLIRYLKLPELIAYLGHANLQCENETEVFHCIMEWIDMNMKDVSEVILKEILCCINYKDMSESEISHMKNHYPISKYDNILKILEYVIILKSDKKVEIYDENFEIARTWSSCRGRYLPKYLFVFNDEFGHEIFYHGHHEDQFIRKVASIYSKSIDGLTGADIQVYKGKIYLFGGEFSMGKGLWNETFWEIDLIRQKLLKTEYSMIKRRHFKSCIIGSKLYIIGGTGPYRLRKNDMYWFDFTTEKWTEQLIQLPCHQTSIKHCNFNEELFIMDYSNFDGYIYKDNYWKPVRIPDIVRVLIDNCPSFSMFPYRGNLFFKGIQLLELELVDDELVLKECYDIPHYANKIQIDTIISNNRVYLMYTDETYNHVRLQYLNLDNLKSVFIEKVGLYCDKYIGDENEQLDETNEIINNNFSRFLRYNPNRMTKMFMFSHYRYSMFEDIFAGDV